MKLSEIAKATDLELMRDAEISSLGLTFFALPKMLVALYDPRYQRECTRNPDVAAVITTGAPFGDNFSAKRSDGKKEDADAEKSKLDGPTRVDSAQVGTPEK